MERENIAFKEQLADAKMTINHLRQQVIEKDIEIERLRDACKLALDAFEKNHAIDWAIIERAIKP